MSNKLTALIDGGWLMMRSIFFFEKGFLLTNTEAQKQHAAAEFQECMARSITKLLNQIPEIDNIVLMSEGGSWRNALPVPEQLHDISYKGHRQKKSELDWTAIYRAYNDFVKNVAAAGITCSQHSSIEGDDWAWYWSRRLNAEGTSVLIWSSDCDLKQLVQVQGQAFTVWYNDKAGLVLPLECEYPDDPIEVMLNPPYSNPLLDSLQHRLKKYECINPDFIVINKVLAGDSGDNIKSVVRYKKGNRTYRFTENDCKKLLEDTNITSIKEFMVKPDTIVTTILHNKKFQNVGVRYEDIAIMIDYNLKLVWLNESTIPDTVTTAMVQFEYKQADMADFRSNYKLLLGTNKSIEQAFNEIDF